MHDWGMGVLYQVSQKSRDERGDLPAVGDGYIFPRSLVRYLLVNDVSIEPIEHLCPYW